MHMELATRRWTVAERDRLPDDGNRYEVVDGALFVTPMPVPRHEEIVKRFFRLLDSYVEAQQIGSAYPSRSEVVFDSHNIAVPDVVVFPFDGRALPARWADAPKPLLVVEVRSDSTWRRDVGAKRRLYVEGAVPEYWIVNDEDRAVTVVRPGRTDERVTGVLRWQPPGVDVALEIDLGEVFR